MLWFGLILLLSITIVPTCLILCRCICWKKIVPTWMNGLLGVDVLDHEVWEGIELPTDCSLMKILFWQYIVVLTDLLVG